jgi:peptidyl-prolyl cis-trans isomerase D
MSVIQKIRDKYARVAVIAIALSLLGFILMDALSGRSNFFDGFSNTVGSVNGKEVKIDEFNLVHKQAEENAKQQGYPAGDETNQQILQGAWSQVVSEKLMEDEYAALGLTISDAEMSDMLFGDNPPEQIKQGFSDSLGRYDAVAAQRRFQQLKNSKDPAERKQVNDFLVFLKKQRLDAKYNALFTNSTYVPKWMVEKRNSDNAQIASISYVSVPYTSIADSTLKVSDDEISDYVKKHSKDFKQDKDSRTISYVLFNVAPSAADTAATTNSLMTLKSEFDTVTTNYEGFVAKSNSQLPYYDGFINKGDIQQANKDSILSAPVGVVYGPYIDGSSLVLSKIIATRTQPDTVKVRHILIATQQQNPQTGQSMPMRDDASAKKLVDSIQGLHKSGTSFDTLVAKFSDDPGSKEKGGVYEDVTTGRMVPSFNDFVFGNPTGSTGVVKTDFGYHYIEILSQKGSSPAYKVAYVGRPITVSQQTEESIATQARMFRTNVNDLESFNSAWEKQLRNKNINKLTATDIGPVDYAIQGVGGSRTFVRSIYDADKGDVLGPEKVGGAYVVAVVTDIEKEGTQSASRARLRVEPLLRNKKKAEMIKKNIGQVTTLEAVSAKTKQPIQTADSISMSGGNNPISFESRVVGAVFNPENKGKVIPATLEGQGGVYVVKVNSTGAMPVANANVDETRKQMEAQARQSMMYQRPVEILRKNATIKDKRHEIF